ncbi:molybdopterin molybdotransferase MoeA [Okibacterium fritillariae]|uniref:molybdopterin molybdotransferase MoeA n=1 Tax=Okibacterium fritillariae TaxID=123320 RepID=UPI00405537F2
MSDGMVPTSVRVVRSVDEHREVVRVLLAPLAARLGADELAVSAERMSRHPHDYDGRVLAADVTAPIDLPPFDNSQMDGYAVASDDLVDASGERPVALRVAAHIPAGSTGRPLERGWAAPIMTGAPIPDGADAVVPIEQVDPPQFFPDVDVSQHAVAPPVARFTRPVAPGTYRRVRGSDIAAGSLLLAAGTRLGAAQWGVLAASGVATVPVRRRVRVTVLSTGHELRQPGDELGPGQIFDANSAALTRALAEVGADVRTVAAVSDDREAFSRQLAALGAETDLLVTTGGVSAGAYEVVRETLAGAGVDFVGVRMQPGGPQGSGALRDTGMPVVTFPGNPVSALISFEVFLRPVLLELAGARASDRQRLRVTLAEDATSPVEKHQIRRGRLREDGRVELIGGPGSHLLHAYAASALLVHIPAGVASVTAGDTLDAWRIDD